MTSHCHLHVFPPLHIHIHSFSHRRCTPSHSLPNNLAHTLYFCQRRNNTYITCTYLSYCYFLNPFPRSHFPPPFSYHTRVERVLRRNKKWWSVFEKQADMNFILHECDSDTCEIEECIIIGRVSMYNKHMFFIE